MKKLFAILMAGVMVFAAAACSSAEDKNVTEITANSALEVLETIWESYGEDEKFAIHGGDYSEENSVEDAPGIYSLEDAAAVNVALGLPEENVEMVDDAASFIHMMNANTFTGAAFHVSDSENVESVVSALKDSIMNRQWMCGFPDKLVIITVGDYVLSAFGSEDNIKVFTEKATSAFDGAVVSVEESLL